MTSMIDLLFEQYAVGRLTRRQVVQALVSLAVPASALAQGGPSPLVRGVTVSHVSLAVRDLATSRAFYERLFGVTKGWPTANPASTIHLALPDGYISLDSSNNQKGTIDHFAVGVAGFDGDAAKRLAATINKEMPGTNAVASSNGTAWTILLRDPDGVRVQIASTEGR